MANNINELLSNKEKLENELQSLTNQIQSTRTTCQHRWGEVEYCPYVVEGYMDPGDPPGTMGIDRRLPCWIDRQVTPIWKRTCAKCKLTQETRFKKTVGGSGGIRGCNSTEEVPDFPETNYGY